MQKHTKKGQQCKSLAAIFSRLRESLFSFFLHLLSPSRGNSGDFSRLKKKLYPCREEREDFPALKLLAAGGKEEGGEEKIV